MAISNLHTLSAANYPTQLFNVVAQLEAQKPSAYFDSGGIITIGIGFNIDGTNTANRTTVMNAMSLSAVQQQAINAAWSAPGMARIRAMSAGPAKDAALQAYLNGVLGTARTFDMSQTEMRSAFNTIVATHETAINALVGAPSLERIALVSLHYNTPELIGPGLTAANAMTDPFDARAEAWYQIRYSHANQLHKRRFVEAAVFGLYDSSTAANNLQQAQAIYRMYTRDGRAPTLSGVDMVQYETTFNTNRIAAQSELDSPSLIAGLGLTVKTLRGELQAAADALIAAYITSGGVTNAPVINPLNIHVAFDGKVVAGEDTTARTTSNADLLIGRDGAADTLRGLGGSDVLVGLSGNDILEGGKGDDILIGGADGDTYIYTTGDGNDRIIDDGAGDQIVIDGKSVAGLFFHQAGDPANTWRRPGDSITLTDNSVYKIVLADGSTIQLGAQESDFQSGDYGIRLKEVSSAPQTTATYLGDKQAADADPVAAGVQQSYDTFGNLVTTAVADVGRADEIYDSNSYGSHTTDPAVNDKIVAGGGDDRVHAGLGDDWLDLGAGRDIGEGGAGNDLIETGTGGDIALGGAGNDRLYGNNIVALSTLNPALLEGGAPVSGLSDLLDGGAGDDILIAGDTADFLLGGQGEDLIIAGGGNDTIYADSSATFTALDWSATRAIVTSGGVTSYNVNRFDLFLDTTSPDTGQADAVYAGAGDDWVFTGAGDDYVEAGTGNDAVFGEAGADTYGYKLGDGHDTIMSRESVDGVVFEAGIAAASKTGRRAQDGLLLQYGSVGNSVLIGDGRLQKPQFADGSRTSSSMLRMY